MGTWEERKRANRDRAIASRLGISLDDLSSLRGVLGTVQRQLPAAPPEHNAAEAAQMLRLKPAAYAWLIRAVVSDPDEGDAPISTEVIREIVANSATVRAAVAERRTPRDPTPATGGRRLGAYSGYVPGLQGWPLNGGFYISEEGDHVHAWSDCDGFRGSRPMSDPLPTVIPVQLGDPRVQGRAVCRKCVPNKIQADRIDQQLSSHP